MRESTKRILVFSYGALSYALFFGVFVYAIGFVGDIVVPRTLNKGPQAPLTEALLVDGLLLGLFALQHTGMARRGFKRWLLKWVPASMERSTYVLATNVAFLALFALWRPINAVVWDVADPAGRVAVQSVYWTGWAIVFLATCMINHFELFGLRQVWLRLRGRPHSELGFRTIGLYKFIRHPIQLGFLVAFWATPTMTAGHLLFAVGTTGYILVALKFFEEPALVREFGETYRRYREQTTMFVPVRRYRPENAA